VGFAVPIDASKKVADTLISGGTVQHAYMGIQIKGVTGGAKITAVTSGSPADRAGLKVGDVITEYAGKPITSASELQAAVFNSNSGETVTVTVQRGGSTKSVQLKLGVRPASPASN
jgi:putative serine protease PepD